MQLEQALFQSLKSDTTLASKLNAGNGRVHIYPLRVPDGVQITQAVTYTEITQNLVYPLVRVSTFQINCIANTFELARDLADDIDRILNDVSETMLGGGFPVKYIKFTGRSALYDENAKLYFYPVDVTIKY
jgi:hypothetical protein